MPYFMKPVTSDCPIAIASIKTVSRLFMIEDKNVTIKPIPMTLLNKP